MNTNKDRYFRTSSFYIACFLFANDQVLANIDKESDPRHAQFVFIDTPVREDLIQAFNFGVEGSSSVLIDARKFVSAIKQLKDKLYQN